MTYDVIIIGAGPGGIFSAYELMQRRPEWKVAVLEAGNPLEKRHCPIDGDKVKSCIHCKTCAIMNGFGGAGAFSDGKYNLTNEFGGTLYEYIGKQKAMELMHYVDDINVACGGAGTKLYSTADSGFKRLCLQNNLHLLDASVRHLGTDINYKVLENLYAKLKDHVDFHFLTPVRALTVTADCGRDGQGHVHGTQVHHLCGTQRQQMDGVRLPVAGYPHQVQPCGYRRAGGTARRGVCPHHR